MIFKYKVLTKKNLSIIFLFIGLLINPIYAEDSAFQKLEEICKDEPPISSKEFFPKTYLKVKYIKQDLCESKISTYKELQYRIIDLLNGLNKILSPTNFNQLEELIKIQENNILNDKAIAQLELMQPLAIVIGSDENAIMINDSDLTKCNIAVKDINKTSNCKSALIEFQKLYNSTQLIFAKQILTKDVLTSLSVFNRQWENFIKKSRSQTPWEIFINNLFIDKKPDFTPPPEKQIIVLHPSLVIENVSDAIDGEEIKETIMMELLGVNWWKQDKWYIPSGVSAIALYSDRKNIDDWGYGVALHFKNDYTLGVTDHSGEKGFFISIDVLKFIQDKKSLLNEYREKIKF